MIDLHAADDVISHYAERYSIYMPENLRQKFKESPNHASSPDYKPWSAAQPCIITKQQSRDKAIGALIGLAVGDAVVTTIEFTVRDTTQVTDMVGGGPFHLKPGEWTDDTSMALCVADTYLQDNRMNTETLREYLYRWYTRGENSSNGKCFDIGNATRYALECWKKQGPSWNGNTEKNTAGNGALIREAPVAIFRRNSLQGICFESESQSRATHNTVESIESCQYLGYLLYYLINGYSKEQSLSPHVFPLCPRVMIINAGEYKQKNRDQIRSSGYVIDTLEAALWAVWNTDNFRDAILLSANLADDADSVAATAGQLAGALYGYSGIPQEWRNKLVQHDRIVNMAGELFDRAPEDDF